MTLRKKALAFGAAAVLLAACNSYNDARGIGDAPVGKRHEAPRQVWQNIDGMMNISAFCIGANGAYTHTREAAPVIVPNDPNCAVGGILAEPGKGNG